MTLEDTDDISVTLESNDDYIRLKAVQKYAHWNSKYITDIPSTEGCSKEFVDAVWDFLALHFGKWGKDYHDVNFYCEHYMGYWAFDVLTTFEPELEYIDEDI